MAKKNQTMSEEVSNTTDDVFRKANGEELKTTVEHFANGAANRQNTELLGGFVFNEKSNGRARDTEKNFSARFEEFKRS